VSRKSEKCAICGCPLHREGDYAKPTVKGRSHATKHHYIPERFFGRSENRQATQREGIFNVCPWNAEGKTVVFCYECHEELLHNPVFLPEDIEAFSRLVSERGLSEEGKTAGRERIAGRIKLLHDVIRNGLEALSKKDAYQVEDK
jgi:hypothetical protein